jgi:hypothetical protein
MTFNEYVVFRICEEEGYCLSLERVQQLIEAGFMDRMKRYGRNAAIAGAIGLAGFGAGKMMNQPDVSKGIETKSVTSRSAEDFLRKSSLRQKMDAKKDASRPSWVKDLRSKGEELKQNKMNKGTYIQGKLQK